LELKIVSTNGILFHSRTNFRSILLGTVPVFVIVRVVRIGCWSGSKGSKLAELKLFTLMVWGEKVTEKSALATANVGNNKAITKIKRKRFIFYLPSLAAI
jgi:hypothetical protein